MKHKYYRLEGHTPVPCFFEEWTKRDEQNRRVDYTTMSGDVFVSTVFLGLDHSFSDEGPPVLFETMVLGLDDAKIYQTRCSTWDEAVAMHEAALAWAKERLGAARNQRSRRS